MGTVNGVVLKGSAGISVGLIDDIPTCKDLVRRISADAEEVISGLSSSMTSTVQDEAWNRNAGARESKL